MEHSESIANLAKALATAQGQMKPAAENAANPFYKTRYADLASIWDACRDALSQNGLAVIQIPGETYNEPPRVELTTILAHASGEWIKSILIMPLVKADPQGYGSAITYARRYALAAIVGVVAGDDDDANATVGQSSYDRRPSSANGKAQPAAPPQPEPAHELEDTAALLATFDDLCREVYGPAAPAKRAELAASASKRRLPPAGTGDPGKLNADELRKLVKGLEEKLASERELALGAE